MAILETDWDNVSKLIPNVDNYRAELSWIVDLDRLHRAGPISYQHYLYALVRGMQPEIIVETGTRKGIATVLVYAAMSDRGHIYSCDPLYVGKKQAEIAILEATGIALPRSAWTYYPMESKDVFPLMPTLEWDLFIHDSDHSKENMEFELDVAWSRVRPGGFIVCDDWYTCVGAKEKHNAFIEWCARHDLNWLEIGSAAVVRRPSADS